MRGKRLLAAAYALDVAFGDPPWLPHPVACIGAVAERGEDVVRRIIRHAPGFELVAGGLLSAGVVAGTFFLTRMSLRLARARDPRAGTAVALVLSASTLATRSLVEHANAVLAPLEDGDLEAARVALARMVGRDTVDLDEGEIARALVECLAESACDGIVAPLFYLAVGGAPLAVAYKAVNTLDSMIGHVEEPYTLFGRFAARLDDAANFVPARMCALLIAIVAQVTDGRGGEALRCRADAAGFHRSPNAGQVEAAMAGALGVRLGGTNRYQGVAVATPFMGQGYPVPAIRDARRAIAYTRLVSVLALGLALVLEMAVPDRA